MLSFCFALLCPLNPLRWPRVGCQGSESRVSELNWEDGVPAALEMEGSGGGGGDETAATSLGFCQGRPQSPLAGWHPLAGQHTRTSRGF